MSLSLNRLQHFYVRHTMAGSKHNTKTEASKTRGSVSILGNLQMPQDQRSLRDQLETLKVVANRLGLYDAADYLGDSLKRKDKYNEP